MFSLTDTRSLNKVLSELYSHISPQITSQLLYDRKCSKKTSRDIWVAKYCPRKLAGPFLPQDTLQNQYVETLYYATQLADFEETYCGAINYSLRGTP